MSLHRSISQLAFLCIASVALACGGGGGSTGPSGQVPASLTLMSGDAQWGDAGAALPAAIVVKVEDASATVIKGVPVHVAVISGDGQAGAATYTTDNSGRAFIVWTLGTHVRDSNRLAITVGSLPALTVTARAEIPSTAQLVEVGTSPSTLPGQPVANPVVTRLTLPDGRPIVGANMQWRMAWAGGEADPCLCGHFGALDSITNESGQVSAAFTMGSDPRSSLIVTSRALYFNPIASIAVTSAPSLMTWTVPRLFTTISSGFDHSCALDAAGNAYCWGYNDAGGIADGGELGSTAGLAPEWPVQVDGSQTFSQLALGAYHSCGLTAAHALYCWGDNRGGEYGDGTRTSHNAPTLVPTSQQFTSIAAGEDFTCGLTSDGTPYCWGTNSDGALGDGTQTDRLTPTPVAGGLHFASFVMNAGHAACALTGDGHAYCWGSNSTGRLGDGTTTDHLTPKPVSGGWIFSQLMAGVDHVCGLVSGGQVYCWGDNSAGQLGDGTQTQRLVPTAVAGGISFQSLGSGLPSFFSCGVGVDGFAYCWGDDYASELATGPEVNVTLPVCHAPTFNVFCSLTPRRIYGPRIFARLSLNLFGVCGQTVTEGAYCWGDDTYGENGDGFFSLTNNTVALVAAPESPNVVSPRRAGTNAAGRMTARAGAMVQSAVPDRRTRHPATGARR